MEVQLIQLVKENRFLYDKSHPNYKAIHLREKTFEEFGRVLNVAPKKLKARWRTLRDNFNKELRADANDTGVSSTKKQWKWMEHLLFLKNLDHYNSSYKTTGKHPRRRKKPSRYIEETNNESEDTLSNDIQEVPLDESKDILYEAIESSFNDDQTTHSSALLKPLIEVETNLDESMNQGHRSIEMDVLPKRDVISKSAVELFFAGLAKQTEDAKVTPKEFVLLQMEILKVFNKEVYNIDL